MIEARRDHGRYVTVGVAVGALLLALMFALALSAGSPSPAGARTPITLASKTFRITQTDIPTRLVVLCPSGAPTPLGGGIVTNPPPGPDGEGVYPNSSERLGAQRGWHVTAVLIDPTPSTPAKPRDVTLQVTCGPKLGHVTPVHKTAKLKSGQSKQAVAKCKSGGKILTGGFLSTNFRTRFGSLATESRRASPKSWRVVGDSFGGLKGMSITSIAYCLKSKKTPLSEISASTTLGAGMFGAATTPTCPAGQPLTVGGYSSPRSGAVYPQDWAFKPDGTTWSVSAFNFGAAAALTAYGYCLQI